MTLEEAIKHAETKIKELGCNECRKEHIQLVEWLKELKEYREEKELNFIEMCNMKPHDEFIEKSTGDIVFLDNDLRPRWKGDGKLLQTYSWIINSKYKIHNMQKG